MAIELEALVGHLYIAGGRAIHTTPPGALVQVASATAARGRELDTFFVMVLPSGDIAPNTFYEQMATMSAERYFEDSGSATAALRNAFNVLNHNLYEHNIGGHKHYEANMICGSLRGSDLYLARVGSAVAVLRLDGQTTTFPPDLTNDETLFNAPLGVQPVPDVKLSRYNINAGTRLIFGDASIAEMSREKIDATLVAGNMELVLDGFRGMVTLNSRLIGVEFVVPDAPSVIPVVQGESTTAIAGEVVTARQQARIALAEQEKKQSKPTEALRQNTKKSLSSVAHRTAQGMEAVGNIVEKIAPEPDSKEQKKLSFQMVTAAVVGIPLAIVAVVILQWVTGTGETEFEQCLRRANEAAEVARGIDSSQRQSVLAGWQGMLQITAVCQELRPDDENIAALRREGQTVVDALNNITRRELQVVATFPNATISQLVLQGLDLYALDDTNNLVYRVQLDGQGQAAGVPQPIANMRQGATVSGLTLGEILDIGFDDQVDTVVAVDNTGVLVRCPPRFINQCDAQRVLASENWVNPIAITIWQSRLYVLDIGSAEGQLWRYDPSGGNYASMPREYFAGQLRPNLARAVDFDISGGGTVYILFSDGVMTSYFGSEPQAFGFSGFPDGQELETATSRAMFLNDSPINTGFYIISQAQRSIYETTLAGTFMNSYQVFDPENLALMTDVAADPGQGIVYVASGNAVLSIPTGGN